MGLRISIRHCTRIFLPRTEILVLNNPASDNAALLKITGESPVRLNNEEVEPGERIRVGEGDEVSLLGNTKIYYRKHSGNHATERQLQIEGTAPVLTGNLCLRTNGPVTGLQLVWRELQDLFLLETREKEEEDAALNRIKTALDEEKETSPSDSNALTDIFGKACAGNYRKAIRAVKDLSLNNGRTAQQENPMPRSNTP